MRRTALIAAILVLANFSASHSQNMFSEIWINGGFGLSMPEMYTIDAIGEEHWEGIKGSQSYEGTFGLIIGMGVKLFEIKEGVFFAPSINYQHLVPGEHLIYYLDYFEQGEEYVEYDYRIKNTLKDLSINGDFYFQVPGRERTLYWGIGVGIHNVTKKHEFSYDPEPWGQGSMTDEIPGLPGVTEENNLIDESETKVGLNLMAKVKLVENLFLEGRIEIIPGFPQFRITASYPLWKKKKF
ncbi:hypothetical protein KAS50_08730 [bacterium]|nr:hypothetical protein [bacterium]